MSIRSIAPPFAQWNKEAGGDLRVDGVELDDAGGQEFIARPIGGMEADRVAHGEGRIERSRAVGVADVEIRMHA